ncbi:MAG: BTAD domain-containing putative transcriptional regulator, partial [Rudaea sp.]
MSHLMLGALGSLQVMAGNVPITGFESDKVRALLLYLAVESHQPHRRDALLGLLWPDSSEDIARRNLRQALYNLRQAIGDHAADPPYLLITREEIQFNPASDHRLDVSTFNSLLDTCDEHLPRCVEVCSVHASRLEQALALYRGPFLHEFFLADSDEFEEWAVQRREQLQRRVLEALSYLGNYYELNQEYEGARRCGLRQLEIDPWREEAHRQVMRVLWAKGDRSGALAQFESCRRVLGKDLGIEPSTETVRLYEQIKRGEMEVDKSKAPAAASQSPQELPMQATPFVGREKELRELSRLLMDPECRLLTLVGPGGIGKTRLALQAAADMKDQFQDGAAFVALAGTDSPGSIAPSIADAIGLVFSGPLDLKIQLLSYLRPKAMLLLLDNVEQLLDGVPLFGEILEQAPRTRLLVTSREQLNLLGEWLFEVEGLDLPGDEQDESLEQSSAVALFIQRARRARQGLTLDEDDKQAVARISRLVGGMPLALELAAAWVRILSPGEIAQEIEGGIDFLAASVRDLPERHRSMRAVFDHSWRLLNAGERAALARLSVFRGGFEREAAEAIAGANLPLLSALLAKSLLHRLPGGHAAAPHSVRYDLHELVRQYAADRLHENPEEEAAARNRHSDYYINSAARLEQHLKGPRQLDALAEMTAEMENIRLGWRHAVTHCRVDCVGKPIRAFWSFFEMRAWYQEAQTLFAWAAGELQRTCAAPVQPETSYQVALAQIQAKQGWFAVRLGKPDEARQLLEP